ncbi:MAG: hypothetical protein COS45_00895 [Candidatus Huberarchaeum crystalense]|uniref:Uncharacterized protein n=1 Tax=Huberarchaeum crystalense TaxID=2014257 RepID=A0A2H9M2F1_HUBC1|nr:MAG: hypothetical protein COS45_00895 [Candidatus Huberarchaeum crystalense]
MSLRNKAKILKTGIRKPRFMRVGISSSHGRLDEKWRLPGIHSHFRRKTEFPHNRPNIGYKQPENLRGLHPSGLRPIWIHNLKELEKVDPKTQGIYVAAQIGAKLKTKIVEDAKKKKIKIFNPKINRKIKIKKVKKEIKVDKKESDEKNDVGKEPVKKEAEKIKESAEKKTVEKEDEKNKDKVKKEIKVDKKEIVKKEDDEKNDVGKEPVKKEVEKSIKK